MKPTSAITTAFAVSAAALVLTTSSGAMPARSGAAATQATFAPCQPDPGVPGAICGTVSVPLDRANPSAGTIPIYFELYRHSDSSRPSLGTIVPSIGGPGLSDTRSIARSLWLGFFGSLLNRRDLLLIDHRGIGNSAAIDCPALQHGLGDFLAAVRACGTQLGAGSDRYASGDVADDVDAVRAALGIDKIDYWGASYGAVDVGAYAYRHADHLRSVVLDSPARLGIDDTFQRSSIRFLATATAAICSRSPSCSAANSDPVSTFAWLARELRRHPFDGVGYDADGVAHMLHVDESTLFDILPNPAFSPPPALLSAGEVMAAATALRHGDRTPLMRLVAENPVSLDYGDPNGLVSVGASDAVYCSDATPPWDKGAPESVRSAQFEAAFAALPADSYAPFSKTAVRASNEKVFSPWVGGCVPWAPPTRPNPPFPPDHVFSTTPALVLGGDFDIISTENERAVAAQFPQGHFIQVVNAGHPTGFWSPCAQSIEFRFITTLTPGNTSCAANPTSPFHDGIFDSSTSFVPYVGVSRFPSQADQALPAAVDPAGVNQANLFDRRIVSVAWSAVEDAFYRASRMSGTSGRGLRGGSYAVTADATTTSVDYRGVHFSNDVAISGHATRDLATNTIDAQVTVEQTNDPSGRQQGHADHLQGMLTFNGVLFTPSEPNGHVRGTIGGHQIALLVPMN